MPSSRLERLRARRIDETIAKSSGANEVYARIAEDDAVKYALGAMQPIDPVYTKNTFIEADRVRDQLRDGLVARLTIADFRYQGSVTSDTHIRVHSDIDLLTLHGGFYTLEPPLVPPVPWTGDPLVALRDLRRDSADVLRAAFPAATVDISRGKAIAISGGSLRRKIDVVTANWWDTLDFSMSKTENLRGVHVYDAKKHERVANKPFMHNEAIDRRDRSCLGGLRKCIRLLKSLKYDAATGVSMSSYDIASIAYRMPDASLSVGRGEELRLVANGEAYLRYLLDNPAFRNALRVPNEMRTIFGSDAATEDGLRQLHGEVRTLLNDIENGLARSFRKLAQLRLEY